MLYRYAMHISNKSSLQSIIWKKSGIHIQNNIFVSIVGHDINLIGHKDGGFWNSLLRIPKITLLQIT